MELKKDGTIFGTPYMRIQQEQSHSNPFKQWTYPSKVGGGSGGTGGYNPLLSGITTGTPIKRCDGPCFCSGACEGKIPTDQAYSRSI